MRAVDLIEKKKRGLELTQDEISFLVDGFLDGTVPDYQMSAFLMAVCFKEMTSNETAFLTLSLMNSGEIYDLQEIEGIKVDKHSTGGVGDKVSLILGPIVASLGIRMAKMSGKGLGFTGGTLDKLVSIPGYQIDLSKADFIRQVQTIGLAIISQSSNIVPGDKKMYSLRDVTGTVAAKSLIVSSIMSKKLATGSDIILLDVKCGDGAFMKTLSEARSLAKEMIEIGNLLGKRILIEISSMNTPLGRAIGNKNEVIEAYEFLNGKWTNDLKEVIFSSASALVAAAKEISVEEALKLVEQTITSGEASEKFKEWISYQGGDVQQLLKPDFWNPTYKHDIFAQQDGYVKITSTVTFGLTAMKLGAGRENQDDFIDNEAGIYLHAKTGEFVKKGDLLFSLYSSDPIDENIIQSLKHSYDIVEVKPKIKTILEKIQ